MRVELENLSVTYRDGDHALLALDRVNLVLQSGQITALVGESGSGKTTLGKSLMGLLPENGEVQGSIRLEGSEVTGRDESEMNRLRWSQVAMVFQNGPAHLNPVYRIVDQVAEPLIQRALMRPREAKKKAGEALERMGLWQPLWSRFPHEMSGGEVQRVLLAMALILDPKVVILDEPTAALDAMTKSFVAQVIRDLKHRKKTILMITHDLDLTQRLADEVVVLYLGQVMETMPSRDLFVGPCHPYTLALGRSFPALEGTRELGGMRGDAFFRVMHAHPQGESPPREHTHVATPGSDHQNGHMLQGGCLFQPRCTQSVEACKDQTVSLSLVRDHQVRCLRGGIVTLLKLAGVGKRYGDVVALSPTSLEVRAGEIFCLLGETGSGKTTLAMIAAGVLASEQGCRTFEDRDMDLWIREHYRSLAGRVGVIYQHPAEAVSHRLSVFEIVAEPLRIQGAVRERAEIENRVKRALDDVHLSTDPSFLKRYPHELNMGAVQRLCMARALILGPSFLVADEPTSSLDPSVQAKVLKMLLDLQVEKGLTMLFVTHDIGLARRVADRIGVMLAGHLVEVGPLAEIMSSPKHPYTRLLLECAGGLQQGAPAGAASVAPRGCPFEGRCPRAERRCSEEVPPGVVTSDGRHVTRCWFPFSE